MAIKNNASLEELGKIQETNWAQMHFMKCNALVAFVDILGFSRIGCMDVNPKIDSKFIAFQNLYNCAEGVFTKIKDRYSQYYLGSEQQVDEYEKEEIQPVGSPDGGMGVRLSPEQYLEVYLISDSVIVVCPLDEVNGCPMSECEHAKMTIIFEFCCELNQLMFEKGLPLRGAIAYGEIYKPKNNACGALNGTALLGKALIEAHEFGESLDAAAIAVCSSAESFLSHAGLNLASVLGVTKNKIHLPLKNKYHCISTNIKSPDVESYVKNCFSRCGKSIEGVSGKIENTIQILKASLLK